MLTSVTTFAKPPATQPQTTPQPFEAGTKEFILDTVTTVDGVADIIGNFTADAPDFEQAVQKLTFNDRLECTNPEIRTLQMQAFMSPDCPVRIKNAILNNAESCPAEFRAMLQEIVAQGYAVYLTDTTSKNLDVSGINFSGGTFVVDGATYENLNAKGTDFSGGSVSDVVVYSGDLSGSVMKKMTCDNYLSLNAAQTNTEGMTVDQAADAGILRT